MRADPGSRSTVYRHRVRYFEADQQGVVFKLWYLGYFDEAMTRFLEEGGLPYRRMLDAGFDVQLVRSEIDWHSSLRWPDDVSGDGAAVATGRTVYAVVSADGSGKRPIPPELAAALGTAGYPGGA